MIRWSMFMILSIASICCLAATSADEKDKAAEKPSAKTEKAESKESVEKKTTSKKEKETSAAKKDGDNKGSEKSEEADNDKFTAKCPVSGEAAVIEQFTAYKEKQVYFCCDKCKAAFEAEPAKFEVKANHQLVQTKQFVQKKCPLTGGPLDKEQSVRVSNVTVRFCCEKCKGSVQSATADEKLEMIFAEKAFKKAYVATKVEAKDGDSKDKPKAKKSEKVSEKKADKPKEKASEKTDVK